MKLVFQLIAGAVFALMLAGCDRPSADGPPEIRLGETVCDGCNMIISDQRWATATIVEGPRGPEPRLFDDFNCQVQYEVEHPELVVLSRWSFSHATGEPVRTEDAVFLMSDTLRTPMGSGVAAFASSEQAGSAAADLEGEVLTFAETWQRLGYPEPSHPTERERNANDGAQEVP